MEKFFNELLLIVQNGSSFIQGQLPDYVNQLLVFKVYENIVGFFVLFLLFAFSLFLSMLSFKKEKETEDEDFRLPAFLFLVLTIAFFSLLFIPTLDIIKIKIAPKVYIVDYLTEKIKSK